MTRKDYVKIARALNDFHALLESHLLEQASFDKLVDSLCDTFRYDNERFDTARFKKAVYDE
jgi:hypothetical protein